MILELQQDGFPHRHSCVYSQHCRQNIHTHRNQYYYFLTIPTTNICAINQNSTKENQNYSYEIRMRSVWVDPIAIPTQDVTPSRIPSTFIL